MENVKYAMYAALYGLLTLIMTASAFYSIYQDGYNTLSIVLFTGTVLLAIIPLLLLVMGMVFVLFSLWRIKIRKETI